MVYISSGKTKDIYETSDNNLIFEFTDRVTAFDGKKKVEYGRTINREILLADELGTPDGCRFWDSEEFEKGVIKSFDKDVFRKGKGDLGLAYVELFKRMQNS